MPTPLLFRRPCAVILPLLLASCSELVHPTSTDLQLELKAQSQHGLALAYVSQDKATIHVRYFDGKRDHLRVACCDQAYPASIRGGRIVLMDRTGIEEPVLAILKNPDALYGRVLLTDSRGGPVTSSRVEVNPILLSAAPDEKQFAFVGSTRDQQKLAVYAAKFAESEVRELMDFAYVSDPSVQRTWSLDWSPDSRQVLVSQRGRIYAIKLDTGAIVELAEGGPAGRQAGHLPDSGLPTRAVRTNRYCSIWKHEIAASLREITL